MLLAVFQTGIRNHEVYDSICQECVKIYVTYTIKKSWPLVNICNLLHTQKFQSTITTCWHSCHQRERWVTTVQQIFNKRKPMWPDHCSSFGNGRITPQVVAAWRLRLRLYANFLPQVSHENARTLKWTLFLWSRNSQDERKRLRQISHWNL